jgi:Uma2 family endonuclease
MCQVTRDWHPISSTVLSQAVELLSAPHCSIVSRLSKWSYLGLAQKRVGIRIQCPVVCADWEAPLVPDIAWVHDKNYYRAHPTPNEVQLIIEVADTDTLEEDWGRKMELLARAKVPEYWSSTCRTA